MFFKKKWFRAVLIAMAALLLLVGTVLLTAYSQQDKMVSAMLERLNHDFEGRLELKGSHISPFANFPYISIDLEGIAVFEGKSDTAELLMQIEDTYVGFDFFAILSGSLDVKKIRLEDGFVKLVQHKDGSYNILNAISSPDKADNEVEEDSSSVNLDLKSIKLVNIDLLKLNESNGVLLEAFLENVETGIEINEEFIDIALESRFLFNLMIEEDTSFLHGKHVELQTMLHFKDNKLKIDSSELMVEKALFMMQGSIDFENDMDLDLRFSGNKPNFDLFLAFAPPELEPVLRKYENSGKIYFDAIVDGPSINGKMPMIKADFGCAEAFVRNTSNNKAVEELFFEGHFSNGSKRDPSTMELQIKDFSAKPETGLFKGNFLVKNFDSPEFDLKLLSDFNLEFLVKFLELEKLEDVTGKVFLEMNFHDIIDFSQPEKSIEKLNESYFTKLRVENLNISSSEYPLPFSDVNITAEMDGHKAIIDRFDFKIGQSDVAITAKISDLPAIIHHTDLPVTAEMEFKSALIDLRELTQIDGDSGINEQIRDLSMRFKFNTTARAFTESPNLPLGEFFIENLHAQLTHYPHELHDFHADVLIDTTDFKVIDFTGMIDQSDFHFNGRLENYDLWFMDNPKGDTRIDFDLTSNLLQLDDLFAYGGENHVPEDYRHEEFRQLKLHGLADLKFDKKLLSTVVDIDQMGARMKVHDMRFKNFKGQLSIDSSAFQLKDFGGELGRSNFESNLHYYFNADSLNKTHKFNLKSDRLDFDQIFAYNPPPAGKIMAEEEHDAGFNIFEVPFVDMDFEMYIADLNYHRYLISDFMCKGRMKSNHYVYLDTMQLKLAGGALAMNGYFNGSDPKTIYFSPNVKVENIDLDKLLFKFENFGQDHLVSENLHGRMSGTITGKVNMHADMVPSIDDSEIHMEFKVVNGSLENYAAFDALSGYFSDKQLQKVRFDTLSNTLDLSQGTLLIPNMNINSNLGYFEVSGSQQMDLSMEYYIRIPLKVISSASMNKLFGKKESQEEASEIKIRDESKRTSFLNLKIVGTPENFDVKLKKDN